MIEFDEYRLALQGMQAPLKELFDALDIDGAKEEVATLEAKSAEDGFWNDLEQSQKVLQKIKQLKDKIEKYEALVLGVEDALTLCELAVEENDASLAPEVGAAVKSLTAELEAQRLATLLSGEYMVTRAEFPRDGYYSEDFKKIFPKSVRKDMDMVHKDGSIEILQNEINEQVELYFE